MAMYRIHLKLFLPIELFIYFVCEHNGIRLVIPAVDYSVAYDYCCCRLTAVQWWYWSLKSDIYSFFPEWSNALVEVVSLFCLRTCVNMIVFTHFVVSMFTWCTLVTHSNLQHVCTAVYCKHLHPSWFPEALTVWRSTTCIIIYAQWDLSEVSVTSRLWSRFIKSVLGQKKINKFYVTFKFNNLSVVQN